MIASSADQDRYSFVFLAPSDRNHCLLLKFDFDVVIDGAGERAQTLLSRDAAEVCNRAFPQLEILFGLSNVNDIGCGGVAVIATRDTAECATLQLARRHRLEEVLQQRQARG